jgi:outer membrane protein assembly factor BamE (lipoprotein component of BamABCDE complex)
MKGAIALALVIVAGMTGCVSPARRLVPKITQQVKPGMSREHVEALLGTAAALDRAPDGRSVGTYLYRREQEAARTDLVMEPGNFRCAGTLLHRMLTVLYSPTGVVERVKFSETETPYFEAIEVLPDWTRRKWVGKQITPAMLQSIQKGVTTAAEIDLMLGDPTWTYLSLQGDEIQGWFYGELNGQITREWRWSILAIQYDDNKVIKNLRVDSNLPKPH